MIGMITRPAVLPFRWWGHGGATICIVIEGGVCRFVAIDVVRAAGINPTTELTQQPACPPAGPLAEHGGGITFDIDQIHALLSDPTPVQRELLHFLHGRLESIDFVGVHKLEKAAVRLRPEAPLAPVIQDAPAAYTVQDAAAILTMSGLGPITRTALFDILQGRSWIYREGETWMPFPDMIQSGLLAVVDVRLPVGSHLYPQILLTPLGLTRLYGWLGGTGILTLPAPVVEVTGS